MSDKLEITPTEKRMKMRDRVQSLAASVRYEKRSHPNRLNHECQDWVEYVRCRDELRALEEADFS